MKKRIKILLCAGACGLGIAAACIIPDKDIVIIINDCGKEWVASTAGAVGYDGLEIPHDIKTTEDRWVAKRYCVTAMQDALLADPNSWLYDEVRDDIMTEVSGRATETYDDLFRVAAILVSANSATVEVIRGTATATLYYQRGS